MLDLAVNWLPIFKSATDHRWLAEKPNIKVHHADPKSAKWEGSIPARDSSRGRNAVNLNKPYIPSLDSTSSTLLADRSRPTALWPGEVQGLEENAAPAHPCLRLSDDMDKRDRT
jgi:hypothetical protein